MALARPSRSRGVEPELHREIARLSVNDIEQLMPGRFEGVGRTSQPDTDTQLAFRLAIEEARALAGFQADRTMALRMQMAEGLPETPPRVVTPERPAPDAARDPTPTQAPATVPRNPFIPQPNTVPAHPRGRVVTPPHRRRPEGGWFASMWNWWFGTLGAAGSSARTSIAPARASTPPAPARGAQHNRPTGHNCVSCMDPIRGVEVRTPCGHYYDKTCILGLFEAAMKDESLFPPRCCRQQIPLASVSTHMGAASLAQFREKTLEFSTRKRVYCAKPSCSRFLGQQYEGGLAYIRAPRFTCTAPGCTTVTCSSCKNEVKSGLTHRCQNDEADDRVLAMGQRSGWARCPGCETMIELNMGCYHMTCRCRSEFCYLCRAPWKTCTCAQWDERRLLVAAEARAEAQIRDARPVPQPARVQPAAAAQPAAQRRQLVEERLRALRMGVVNEPAAPRPDAAIPVVRTYNPTRQQTPAGATSAAPRPIPGSSTAGQDQRRPQAANIRDREELVLQWVQRLRDDHDCNHGGWTYRRGAGMCEVCHDQLPLYLFRCDHCDMKACRRCRWNRL